MRIGILNCSDIAKRRTIPAMKKISDITIVGVCSRDKKRAKEFAIEFDVPMYTDHFPCLAQMDAVYISSPPSEHYDAIKYFLTNGIHVFCEKSLTTSEEKTRELIDLAEEKGLIIMENYAFQFHPQWKFIVDTLNEGRIGKPLSIRSSFEFPKRPNSEKDFRYNPKLGGGALLDCGGYPLMIPNLLIPDGSTVHNKGNTFYREDLDIYGNLFIGCNYASFNLSWGIESFYRCDLEILGTEGRIKSEKIFTPKADETVEVVIETKNPKRREVHHFVSDQFEDILREFVLRVKTGDNSHHSIITAQSQLQEYAKASSIRTIIE